MTYRVSKSTDVIYRCTQKYVPKYTITCLCMYKIICRIQTGENMTSVVALCWAWQHTSSASFSQCFAFCAYKIMFFFFFFFMKPQNILPTFKKNINGHHLKKTYKEWCAAKHNATTNSVSQQRVFWHFVSALLYVECGIRLCIFLYVQ